MANVQEECLNILVDSILGNLLLPKDHRRSSQEHQDTVTNIAKHDRKQEWERNDSIQTRVDFLIRGNTIRIDQSLETFSKLVGPVERGRSLVGTELGEDGRDRSTSSIHRATQAELDSCNVSRWTPAFSDKGLSTLVIAQQVERLVDFLFALDSICPRLEGFGDFAKLNTSGLTHIVQDIINIFKAGRNLAQSIGSLVGRGINVVESATHGLGDFANLGEELLTVSENDENILECLLSRNSVDKRLLNFRVVHVEVTSQDSPKNTLKCGHSGTINGARDKFEIKTGQASFTWKRAILGSMLKKRSSVAAVLH